MRKTVIALTLALITLTAWSQDPMNTTAAPVSGVPEEVLSATCALTAWALGSQDPLTDSQRSLLRMELDRIWESGDPAAIQQAMELPLLVGSLHTLEPDARATVREQMRIALIQNAQQDPNSPSSQVVREIQLRLQPVEIWPPPLTEEIFGATERLVAWAFGYRSLAQEHRLLLLDAMEERWNAEDRAVIELCQDIPDILQVIFAQPERYAQNQAHWRGWMMRAAAQRPDGPFASLIAQLIGQPIEIWGSDLGEAGPVPNVLPAPSPGGQGDTAL